jgi:environmental stress-induced protein Ves
MTRRGRVRHTVRRESFGKPANVAARTGSTIVLFALEDGLTLDSEQLHTHDTAIISASQVVVVASTDAVTALVVELVDIYPNVL